MDLSSRIPNYKSTEWKYMIDDNCNFWIMRNEYIERNFIIKEKEGKQYGNVTNTINNK